MSAKSPLPIASAPEICLDVAPGDDVRSAFSRYSPYLVPFGIAAIYLSFPTRNYYWDGISFATSIENAGGFSRTLIHPHHLLYSVMGYAMYRFAQVLGWHGRAVHVLQFANGLFSVASALLLYRFLLRTVQSQAVSLIMLLGFSFSATWWKYSTDADAYIPCIFFLLICLNLLLAVERVRPVLIALAHTASMCLHQLALFFLPAVVVGMLVDTRYNRRKRVQHVLVYSTVAGLSTLAINYYCFHLASGAYSVGAFGKWLTNYVQGPESYSFSFDLLGNVRYTLRAQVRLLFEGRINWLKGSLSLPVLFLIGLLIAVVIFLGFRVAQSLPRKRMRPNINLTPQAKTILSVCIAWVAAYIAFLFFWYPYFSPYRMFLLPALVIGITVLLFNNQASITRPRTINIALFVAAMALSNFLFFIFPLSHSNRYPPLDFATQLSQSWSDRTTVFYAKSNADNQLVRYFNPHTTWKTAASIDTPMLEDEMRADYRAGRDVWLEATAIDELEKTDPGKQWLQAHADSRCRQKFVAGGYAMTFQQVFPAEVAATGRCDCLWVAAVYENSFK